MKLERVIENLTAGREDCGMIPSDEFTQTIDLAIEAVKSVVQDRALRLPGRLVPLPGETPIINLSTLPDETEE